MHSSWFYFVYFILLFLCQICHVNCETENWKEKKIIFKKVSTIPRRNLVLLFWGATLVPLKCWPSQYNDKVWCCEAKHCNVSLHQCGFPLGDLSKFGHKCILITGIFVKLRSPHFKTEERKSTLQIKWVKIVSTSAGVVVVVKWSAYSPSTPTFRIRIPLTSIVFSVGRICIWKVEK